MKLTPQILLLLAITTVTYSENVIIVVNKTIPVGIYNNKTIQAENSELINSTMFNTSALNGVNVSVVNSKL